MMNLLPEQQTLSDWLRIATSRLADPAKRRIQIEIEAHYAQAVDAHRESGLSETDAHAAALTELGDPQAAKKRFREQHLTEREEKRLRAAEKAGRSIWNLLGCYSLFWLFTNATIARNVLTHFDNPWSYLMLQIVLFIVIPTACFVVARRSRTKPNRHLLWMGALNDLGSPLVLYIFFTSLSPSRASILFDLLFGAGLLLPGLARVLFSLHTFMKITRLQNISTHTPPSASAQT